MEDETVDLTPATDPNAAESLLSLRARIATDIAGGRETDLVLDELTETLTNRIAGSHVILVETDENDVARICSSNAPGSVQRLIHGTQRRHWFGAWAAALSRRHEIAVTEVAASSLYSDHRRHYVDNSMLAVRAVPINGRHHVISGVLSLYLSEQRILSPAELDIFDEVASLISLAIRYSQANQELLDQLRHDPLTGLENRDGLEYHIRRSLDAAGGRGGVVGLLFVDIDDLTLVNDSLGHTAGDLVIASTADRIRKQLLPGDAVVRFGGDEFIVVLERIDDIDDALRVGDRIRRSIGEPIVIDDNELAITVSIGITSGGPKSRPLELIDEGHAAVVRAKQDGRGSTAVHDRSLDTGAGDRLGREMRLRQGLDADEFQLFWQPKVQLSTGTIVGAEALIRWNHPELGVVGPDEFIGTAERAGLIDELSDWVLQNSIRNATAFEEYDPDFAIAINMSATQLARDDFLSSLRSALETHGLDPKRLIVELTESVLANDRVEPLLYDLRKLGVRAAIDDFGTGYSSLAYVQQLPIDTVKIDRAFLVGLDAEGNGAPVLTAAIAMAKALKLTTTVEGVETADHLAGLRALGADWGQGYLFAEPSPQDMLLSRIREGVFW